MRRFVNEIVFCNEIPFVQDKFFVIIGGVEGELEGPCRRERASYLGGGCCNARREEMCPGLGDGSEEPRW